PDVLLYSQDRGHRLQAIIEVETGESVNHLEALSQWAAFGRLRIDFFLYVPANMVDVARRLCEGNQIRVNEIWSYHLVGDQFRFTLMHRTHGAAPAPRPTAAPRAAAAPRATARPLRRPDAARSSVRRRAAPRAAKSGRATKPA